MKQENVLIVFLTESHARNATVSCLSDDERRRAAAFKFPEDATRWRAFRAGLRHCLADCLGITPHDVPLVLGEFGKPGLASPFDHLHFNLSHCGDTAIVAICSEGPVGIDIEALDRAPSLLGCEQTFCHPDEIIALPDEEDARAHRLLELWTAKEALLKALGTGFSHPPEQVKLVCNNGTFTLSPETPLMGAEAIHILRVFHPQATTFLTAVAVPRSVAKVNF